MKTEKISADDVEVINTSKNPEKKSENFGAGGFEDNPMMKMMENMEEIKKIKAYFLIALIAGFWSLFGLTTFMAPVALVFGVLDLSLGSKLTEKASYIGMIFAVFALLMEFKMLS